MLRKLLKHEFRATARVMIPLYLITVLLAVLTRATALWAEMVTFDGMLGRNFLALLSGIIIFGFALLATGALLYLSDRLSRGKKTEKGATVVDALLVRDGPVRLPRTARAARPQRRRSTADRPAQNSGAFPPFVFNLQFLKKYSFTRSSAPVKNSRKM